MVSMASNLMLADERVLWMAQREDMACSRIIACLQKMAVHRLAAAQSVSLVSRAHLVTRCVMLLFKSVSESTIPLVSRCLPT